MSSGRRDGGHGAIGAAFDEAMDEAEEIGAGLWASVGRAMDFIGDLTGIGPVLDRLSDWCSKRRAARGPVAFTVALIALSAKMAKADGIVSADEVQVFRKVVEIPPGEERNVERLFELAQRDVAGFEGHAARIAEIARGDAVFLGDVLEGLFHIAAADAWLHERELAFLERVGEIFGLDQRQFDRIAGGFVRRPGSDPYRVLGVARDASDEVVKSTYRRQVTACHPDLHFARGLPKEAMAILTDRLAALNTAWEQVRLERGLT